MYIKWDANLGQPTGLPSNFPLDDDSAWVPLIEPAAATSAAQCIVWELIRGNCVGRWRGSADPLDAPATLEQIKTRYLELENSPIDAAGVLIEADALTEKRLRDYIISLDEMPFKDGVVEQINGVKVLCWKAADNTWHKLSKASLELCLNNLILKRSIRSSILFERLQALKPSIGDHTIKQINLASYWGL